jgi:hypothetical protein
MPTIDKLSKIKTMISLFIFPLNVQKNIVQNLIIASSVRLE